MMFQNPIVHQQVDTTPTNLHRCNGCHTHGTSPPEPFNSDGGSRHGVHLLTDFMQLIMVFCGLGDVLSEIQLITLPAIKNTQNRNIVTPTPIVVAVVEPGNH